MELLNPNYDVIKACCVVTQLLTSRSWLSSRNVWDEIQFRAPPVTVRQVPISYLKIRNVKAAIVQNPSVSSGKPRPDKNPITKTRAKAGNMMQLQAKDYFHSGPPQVATQTIVFPMSDLCWLKSLQTFCFLTFTSIFRTNVHFLCKYEHLVLSSEREQTAIELINREQKTKQNKRQHDWEQSVFLHCFVHAAELHNQVVVETHSRQTETAGSVTQWLDYLIQPHSVESLSQKTVPIL